MISNAKLTFLSFILNNETYAISVTKLLEVLEYQEVKPLPEMIGSIEGITKYREQTIPVFETRTKFALPTREADQKYVIIILEIFVAGKKYIVGAIVDSVKDVMDIAQADLKPMPLSTTTYLKQIANIDNKFIMILDPDYVFNESEITQVTAYLEELKRAEEAEKARIAEEVRLKKEAEEKAKQETEEKKRQEAEEKKLAEEKVKKGKIKADKSTKSKEKASEKDKKTRSEVKKEEVPTSKVEKAPKEKPIEPKKEAPTANKNDKAGDGLSAADLILQKAAALKKKKENE